MQPKTEVLSLKTKVWVKCQLGNNAEIVDAYRLPGSTSSDLYAIRVREKGAETRLVLRLLTNQDWLAQEPDLAEHEAAALQMAKKSGLPVPEVVAWDASGADCGVPAVLMTSVPGKVNLQPRNFDGWLMQMAKALQPLHAVDAEAFGWQYFAYNDVKTLEIPTWTTQPDLWKRAIELVNQPPPLTRTCFIHRDYHPMNTLWEGDTLCGIVDWVNACSGPAPFDLAWNRINLMQMYGVKAAEDLRKYALDICGEEIWHPYWDLMALIEMLPGPPEVYAPWPQFGLKGLSAQLSMKRSDEYLVSLLKFFNE